jgi:DNA-binding IclR family transcriptional regulator
MTTAKSCRKIEVIMVADQVLEVIRDAKEPISVTDIARATGLSVDSCFRQIGTMSELRWVEKIGDGYIIGMKMAGFRAKKIAQLLNEADVIHHKLEELEEG